MLEAVPYFIKQGATSPPLRAKLLGEGNAAIDLTDWVVNVTIRAVRGSKLIQRDVTPTDPDEATAGLVQMDWQADDTDTPGEYQVEFTLTKAGSVIEVAPNDGYELLRVIPALA